MSTASPANSPPRDTISPRGDKIREYREAAGLSIRELAQLSGVGVSTLYKIEDGLVSDMMYSTLLKITSALDVTPDLVTGLSFTKGLRRYYSYGQEFLVVTLVDKPPIPPWFDQVVQSLTDLMAISRYWTNTYGAPTIDRPTVQRTLHVVTRLLDVDGPLPFIVPLQSGGLRIVWSHQNIDLVVTVDVKTKPFVYYRNHANGEESEYPLPGNENVVKSILKDLVLITPA